MTKEDIMKLAEHQGLVDYFDLDGDTVGELMLVTLVLDCIAAEREACAKVCESMRPTEREFDQRFYTACTLNANAIRARGEK